MSQLTTQQQTALEFYAANEQYVINFGLSNLDREDRLVYRQGKKLMQSVLTKKAPQKLEYYNNDERTFIAVGYDQGLTRKQLTQEFISHFGNTHSADSVGQKYEMCRNADTLDSNPKFQFRDQELIVILQSLDSDRYQLAVK